MKAENILDLVQYIATQTILLKNKYLEEKDLPIDYLTVFSHTDLEFSEMKKIMDKLGKQIDEHNGPVYKSNQPIDLPTGKLFYLRIRQPDSQRPQKGCDDFRVKNYQEFKQKYKSKFGKNLSLIIRPDYEMIEIKDKEFDVLTYFPSFSFSESLQNDK